MQVERRQRLALNDDRFDAVEAGEQPDERSRYFEDEAGPGGDERGIATKLDRVAQALLGVQQQDAVADLLAEPQRLREPPAEAEPPDLPAPFVFPPAFGELTVLQKQEGEVEMGIRRSGSNAIARRQAAIA